MEKEKDLQENKEIESDEEQKVKRPNIFKNIINSFKNNWGYLILSVVTAFSLWLFAGFIFN